jgi:hypothetical protein
MPRLVPWSDQIALALMNADSADSTISRRDPVKLRPSRPANTAGVTAVFLSLVLPTAHTRGAVDRRKKLVADEEQDSRGLLDTSLRLVQAPPLNLESGAVKSPLERARRDHGHCLVEKGEGVRHPVAASTTR